MRRSLSPDWAGLRGRVAARVLLLIAVLAAAVAPAAAQALSIDTGPSLGTWSLGQDQIPLPASGGSGNYHWSIAGGTLPPGLHLRTDVPIWFAGNAQAGLIGVATTPGTYSFTLEVTDGSAVVDQAVTLRITGLVVRTPYNLPQAYVGVPYSTQLAAAGPNGSAFVWAANGSLPPGLTLGSDGVLSGTPSTNGFYNVPFSVTDGIDTLYWNLSLDVYRVQITTAGALPPATVNQFYSQTVDASSPDGGISFSASGLPAGLTLAGNTISGTVSQQGRTTFSLTATDAANNSYSKLMTLWVMPAVVQPPGVSPGNGLDDCTIGVNCLRGVYNWFGGRPPFAWSATGLPQGMAIRSGAAVSSWMIPGDGELFGVPTSTGTFTVSVTVTDADGRTGTNTFPLHVAALAVPDPLPSGRMGVGYVQPLRILGGDTAYTVTQTGGHLPQGVSISGAGLLSGVPLEGGSFDPRFTITDGSGEVFTYQANLFIASAGDPAVNLQITINADLGVAALSVPYSTQFFSCCVPVTWSLESGSLLPPGLSLSPAGALSGTPSAADIYSFAVRATDASNPANYTSRRFTLAVSPVGIVGSFTLPTGNANTFYSDQLQASGGSGSYIWSVAPGSYLPAGLTLTSGGLLSGVPGVSGQFQFRVNVVDTLGNPQWAYLNLTLYPFGQHPPITIQNGPDFGTWSIGDVQYGLTALDGSGQYTWSLLSGTLPPGLAVRGDGPPWFSPTVSGGVIGVATTPGTYNFTLRVTDGNGTTADLAATMTITGFTLKDWYAPDASVSVPYSFQLTPLNAPGPITWSATYGLPPGLTLDSSTGLLSGTPTTPGYYNVSVQASAGGVQIYRNVNIGVYAIRLSTSTPLAGGTEGELPNAVSGQPYTATITASGAAGPFTFSASYMPPGLSLDPQSGIISGIFNGGPSSYYLSITATSNQVSRTANFTIHGASATPSLPSLAMYDRLADCSFGESCERTIYPNGGALAPFTWSASGLPAGMSLRPARYSPGALDLWGVPLQLGDFQVTITLTDAANQSVSGVFPLHVSELELSMSYPNITYGQPFLQKLRIIGGNPGYTATIVNPSPNNRLPLGLTLDSATQTISGTPTESGSFNVDYLFSDSASPQAHTLHLRSYLFVPGPATSTVQINSSSDLGYIATGQTLNMTIFACCLPSPSVTWSLVSGTTPAGFTVSPQANGGGNGIISTGSTTLASGVYTFALKVADANDPTHNFAVRQFTLTVTPLSFPPGFPYTLPFGNVGTPYSQTPTINGASPAGSAVWTLDPYSVLPPGLTLAADGTISGTPSASGQFQFTVRIVDGAGDRQVVSFSLSIYPAGQAPPMAFFLNPNQTAQIGVYTFPFSSGVVTGGLAPYHFALAPGAPVIPGLRVQDGQPLPTYFSFSNTTAGILAVFENGGTYTTTIRVTDSAAIPHFVDRQVTFTVAPLYVLTPFSPPRATVNTPYSLTLEAAGGTGALTWSGTNLPAGLTLSAAGVLQGTPQSAGNFFLQISVADSAGHLASYAGALTVDPYTISTPAVLPSGVQNQAYSQQLTSNCGSCTWSGTLPVFGLTLSPSGLISGTPANSFDGSFQVQLMNGTTAVQSRMFTLTIQPTALAALSIQTSSFSFQPSTVGNTPQTNLSASGGVRPYTWSIDSGALPPGILLASDGSSISSNVAPNTGFIYGRLMQTGTFTFTLRVTDATGAWATRTFTQVVSGLNFQYTGLPLQHNTLTRGTPYSQPLLVIGGTNQYSWAATMPAGLTLDPVTGVVSGTPQDSGFFSVPVTVSDSGGRTLTNTISMSIGGGSSPVNFGAGSTQGPFQIGQNVNINLFPSGGTAPYTVTALNALPPGLALLSDAAVLSGGTPGTSFFLSGTPAVAGTFTVTLQVQDALQHTGERTFVITVSPVTVFTNTGLLNGSSLPDGSVGAPYAQQLVAFDAAGPVVWSLSQGTLPAGLTLSPAGLVSGTPTTAATYSFQVSVLDVASGVSTTPGSYSLKISPMAIVAPAALPAATALEPYAFTFGISGAPGAVAWSATGLPNGVALSSGGVLSGTPGGGGTTFQITVTATSGSNTVTRRVTLYVQPSNITPPSLALLQTALPDATVGQIYSFTLNPTGGLPPHTWSVKTGDQLPSGLSLLSGAQLTPNVFPGFTIIAGQPALAGQYSFTLVLTDSQGRETERTFTLNVSEVTIVAGTLRTVVAGQAYAQQLTATGGTGPYTFSLAPLASAPTQTLLPAGLTFSSTGLLSGNTTLTGNYNFVVWVHDSAGHGFSRSYRLTAVTSTGLQITSADPADAYVGGGIRQDLATNSGPNFTWTLQAGGLPPGVVLTPAGSMTGQPSLPGVYSYTVRATSNANNTQFADHAFTFNVAPMQVVSPPASILTGDLPPAHVGVPYSTTIKVAGGTPPYSFAVSPATPLPLGLTLGTDGTLSGTPLQNGTGTVAVVVTDAASLRLNTFAFALFITPAGVPAALTTVPNTSLMGNASVGVPYRFALDIQRGGVAPFSWTLASGSALPAGLGIVHGSGGVPDYLAGVPTAPGHYTFSLVVADSSGQTAKTPFTLDVSPLALTPSEIPRGKVGVPYSVSLVPSGGTAPYAISALADWDMPPGLALNGATVSGTPTHAGSWLVRLLVTDSAANTLSEVFEVTVDNAAGEAPAVTFGQRSVLVTYVQGAPAPGPVTIPIASTSTALPFNAAIEGLPGAALSPVGGTTPASVSLDAHAELLAPGSYSGVLALTASAAANVGDAIPVLVTVLTPPPCGYTLTPGSASAQAGGGTGTFSLDTGAACGWTAIASDPWISVTSAASGTGPVTVQYSVAANTGSAQRAATITAGGQTFTITQFGSSCSFAISPLSLAAPASGGVVPVTVTASGGSCPWTASSSTGLTVSPTSDAGSDIVNVTIPANTQPGSRTLTATVAGQTFTVVQSGIDCAVSLSPLAASFGDAGGSGSFAVNTAAACGYSTTSSPNWVAISSGAAGTGPGTLVFTVAANSATTPRTGSIIVGGQSFSISQAAAACSVTLNTSSLTGPFATAGGTASVGVNANGDNCAWTASSPVNWASVAPSGASGTGGVTITVAANPNVGTRSTTLGIAGQSVTISQGGQACSYALQSTNGSAPASGGSATVGVVTAPACAWSAVSNAPAWLSVSPGSSSGAVSATFTAAANPDPSPRSGTLTIAGQTFTVTQAAAACTYTLASSTATVAGEGASGLTLTYSGGAACAPVPVSYAGWITVDQASFSGGSGTVTYSVLPNPLSTARTGVIQIADETFTVTQPIAQSACRYSLHEYGALFNRGGGGGDVFGSATDTACNPGPTIGTDQPGFILLGPLQGPLFDVFTQPYTVSPFDTPLIAVTRRGTITFGGQIFMVKQVSW